MTNPESPLFSQSPTPSGKSINSAKTIAAHDEIGIDNYDCYLDVLNDEYVSERGIVTDRFIPTRKMLKTELIVK